MPRSKLYQVKDNRIFFKCDQCKSKRSLPVPPRVKSRSVKCHKCGAVTRCSLNRRQQPRSQQTGKATMILSSGRELTVDLYDISPGGVGVVTPPGAGRLVSLREEVHIKCSWDPRLFSSGRYIIKSINGSKVGIQNVAKKTWA